VPDATLLYALRFDGAGYPSYATPWPGFTFPASGSVNPSGWSRPVVDGYGHGGASRSIGGVTWRGICTTYPGRSDYQADLLMRWKNPGYAGRREVGLIVRGLDVNNCLVARLRSMVGASAELRLFKVIAGVETQLGATYTGIGAAQMEAPGVRIRVRVEDLQDGTGNTRVTVYKNPTGATAKGTSVIDWTGAVPQLRGAHRIGVELRDLVYWGDVYVDDLEVYDLADEWAPTGSPGTGWQIEIGNTLYSTDDLNALFPATGTTQKASWSAKVRQAYGPQGNQFQFTLRGRFEGGTFLFPGQRIRVFHDGLCRFRGVVAQGKQGLAPAEDQTWIAYDAYWASRQIRVAEDDRTGTLAFNVWDTASDSYRADRQNQTIGTVAQWFFDRYLDRLRFYGCAPPDRVPYETAELAALDAKIYDLSLSGTFPAVVSSLLRYCPKFQPWVDPQTLIWHFRDVTTLTAEDVRLSSEWVTLAVEPDRDKAYTFVEWFGAKKEKKDTVTYKQSDGTLEPAWTKTQEDTYKKDKRHRTNHVGNFLVAANAPFPPIAGQPENAVVYIDVPAAEGLEPDDWRGAICTVNGDGYDRWVCGNTSTRIWLSSPLWGGGIPPAASTYGLSLVDPDAIPALSAMGVGRVYFFPPVEICGYQSAYDAGLRYNGICGKAQAVATGEDGEEYSQEYQYRVYAMTAAQQAAGFCDPLIVLSEKPKPPIALINYLPPPGGSPPDSACEAGNSNKPAQIPMVDVQINVSELEEEAPYFRYPPLTAGGLDTFHGPAYSDDPANWDGGGQPSGTDWGVTQGYTVEDPDFVDLAQKPDLLLAAQYILDLKSQKPYMYRLKIASPWAAVGPVAAATTSRWAGLQKRVTISSAKRTTGFESAAGLMVFSVTWDIGGNTTELEAGSASGWLAAEAQDVAAAFNEKRVLRKVYQTVKDLETFRNALISKAQDRVAGQQAGAIDGCDVQVINENTRRVSSVSQDDEDKEEWINHQALRQKLESGLFGGIESSNPGAKIAVPGLDGASARLAHDGPVLRPAAQHDAPFSGPPTGIPNADRGRYGGLIETDRVLRGGAPQEIIRIGGYAFRKAVDVGGRYGGAVALEYSPTGTDGAPTGPWSAWTKPSDLPNGLVPLSALSPGSTQHQLLERSRQLAERLLLVESTLEQLKAPGESLGGGQTQPADLLAEVLTSVANPWLQVVPASLTDPGGLVWAGPKNTKGADAELYWRVMVPERVLVRVQAVPAGTGFNGGDWAWYVDPAVNGYEYMAAGYVIHKQVHPGELQESDLTPGSTLPAAGLNPFGYQDGIILGVGGVVPSEAGAVIPLPSGARGRPHIEAVFEEDPAGAPVPLGGIYGGQIRYAYKASPWAMGAPINGTFQGDGANQATGNWRGPADAVPTGLRSPYGPTSGAMAVGAMYGIIPVPGATVIMIGVGVDLAVVEGGYMLLMAEGLDLGEAWVHTNPSVLEHGEFGDAWALEFGKAWAEGIDLGESWSLELNPPLILFEQWDVAESWVLDVTKALSEGVEIGEVWAMELNPP
jgi:hypothetical protein